MLRVEFFLFQTPHTLRVLCCLAALLLLGSCAAEEVRPIGPSAELPELEVKREVVQGTHVRQPFKIRNRGTEDLRIESFQAPPELQPATYPSVLKPDEEGEIVLGFDTTGLTGAGILSAHFTTNEPVKSRHTLILELRIVPVVEVRPQNRVYFFGAPRGELVRKELEIVNHQDQPLRIEELIVPESGGVTAELSTLSEGRHYRLALTLQPDAPPGRSEETLELRTDSPTFPRIPIFVRYQRDARIRTEPNQVVYSRILQSGLDQEWVAHKRVLVEDTEGGPDFRILAATVDVPFIGVETEVREPGVSYLVHLRIDPERAVKGTIDGTLVIRTNHPEFPELRLPVTGSIE